MSQNARILHYLLEYPSGLTALEALNKFGCFRLASRIHDIKDQIPEDKTLIHETVKINDKSITRYRIVDKGKEQYQLV